MKKAIVLTYDLGLKGDYNGLYTWLDNLEAKECGKNVAVFVMNFKKNDFDSICEELKREITNNVKLEQNDRIYVILRDSKGMMKGSFIFGGRKRSPWEGFSTKQTNSQDNF
jgi:hypothetical protein